MAEDHEISRAVTGGNDPTARAGARARDGEAANEALDAGPLREVIAGYLARRDESGVHPSLVAEGLLRRALAEGLPRDEAAVTGPDGRERTPSRALGELRDLALLLLLDPEAGRAYAAGGGRLPGTIRAALEEKIRHLAAVAGAPGHPPDVAWHPAGDGGEYEARVAGRLWRCWRDHPGRWQVDRDEELDREGELEAWRYWAEVTSRRTLAAARAAADELAAADAATRG